MEHRALIPDLSQVRSSAQRAMATPIEIPRIRLDLSGKGVNGYGDRWTRKHRTPQPPPPARRPDPSPFRAAYGAIAVSGTIDLSFPVYGLLLPSPTWTYLQPTEATASLQFFDQFDNEIFATGAFDGDYAAGATQTLDTTGFSIIELKVRITIIPNEDTSESNPNLVITGFALPFY